VKRLLPPRRYSVSVNNDEEEDDDDDDDNNNINNNNIFDLKFQQILKILSQEFNTNLVIYFIIVSFKYYNIIVTLFCIAVYNNY
jgi:hypothetical protein